MSYRDLPGIDNTILEGVIALASENGIAKISSRTLAKRCGISDFTVFDHFKTKKNLLYSAYALISAKMNAFLIQSGTKDRDPHKVYTAMVDYLVDHPTYLYYITSYTSVKDFDLFKEAPDESIYTNFIKTYVDYFPVIKNLTDKEIILFWFYIGQCATFFATLIVKGEVENTPKSKEMIADIAFSYLLSKK
ncbi:MAG: TetR/AcrR family transcriptional regulator [Bacilli bacterium]|jgi:AcrR family transcriptional regulator